MKTRADGAGGPATAAEKKANWSSLGAGCLGMAAVSCLFAVLNGYVLMVLWGWFVVPQFHAPPLRLPTAIGLETIFGFVAYRQEYRRVRARPRRDTPWYALIMQGMGVSISQGLLRAGIALAFGAVVHLFVR